MGEPRVSPIQTGNQSQEQARRDPSKWLRLVIGSIPYLLFLIALTVISIGFFSYVVNESILAVFLTQKDTMISADEWNGKDWSAKPPMIDDKPILEDGKRAVVRPNDRLLVPFFYIGEQIGTINFPRIGHSVPAIQGDNEAQFRLGAGHSLGSYMPGQGSNIVFGAHRTSHFKNLQYVKVGDIVQFDAVYGSFTYQIDEIRIIDGGDGSVGSATDKERLTLYTCYPFTYIGNAPKRYVLLCSLIESEIFK